jgi:hypothetical protein
MAHNQIDFTASAVLKKYPSVGGLRNPDAQYRAPYTLLEGTLDECIREFMSKSASQHALYEIHTRPQLPLVTEVLTGEHIVELARLRDFL